MEIRKTIELLRATIDPNQRQQAEAQLDQVCKCMCLLSMCIISLYISDTQNYRIRSNLTPNCYDGRLRYAHQTSRRYLS